jgi:OOP family OmpA-OmpF porin
MNRAHIAIVCGSIGLGQACAPKPVATLPQRPAVDVVMLMPDPDSGAVGRATVTAAGGSVDLTAAREATRVTPGQPPGAPQPASEAEIARLFSAALDARPSAPRSFELYFQRDSDELTRESQPLLEQIVAFVRNRPVSDATVIGHTDTTGDAAYNEQLGMQRARLIRDRLVAIGLPPDQADTASHGEADPAVRTADGVSEPRNRRVEVTVR